MKAHHINVIIARILPRHQKLQNIIGQDNDMRACHLRVTRTRVKKFNWRTIGGHSGQEEERQDLSSSNVDLSSSWRCWIHLSCQTALISLQNILMNEWMRLKLLLLGWIADNDLTKLFMAAALKVSIVDTLKPFPPLEGTEMKIPYIDFIRFSQMSSSQTKQCEQDTWTLFPVQTAIRLLRDPACLGMVIILGTTGDEVRIRRAVKTTQGWKWKCKTNTIFQ